MSSGEYLLLQLAAHRPSCEREKLKEKALVPRISAHKTRTRSAQRGSGRAVYWFISIADCEHPKFVEFVQWCRDNWHGSEVEEDWGYDMQREVIYQIYDDFDALNDDFTLRIWTANKGDAALFKLTFSEHFNLPAS